MRDVRHAGVLRNRVEQREWRPARPTDGQKPTYLPPVLYRSSGTADSPGSRPAMPPSLGTTARRPVCPCGPNVRFRNGTPRGHPRLYQPSNPGIAGSVIERDLNCHRDFSPIIRSMARPKAIANNNTVSDHRTEGLIIASFAFETLIGKRRRADHAHPLSAPSFSREPFLPTPGLRQTCGTAMMSSPSASVG